jgi:hypothetical protein
MNLGLIPHRKPECYVYGVAENTYVVGEVCVHDYHKISGAKLQAVDVGGPATRHWDNEKI